MLSKRYKLMIVCTVGSILFNACYDYFFTQQVPEVVALDVVPLLNNLDVTKLVASLGPSLTALLEVLPKLGPLLKTIIDLLELLIPVIKSVYELLRILSPILGTLKT